MRYKEYKKTDIPWLDEVPSHWEIVRNKNLFKHKKNIIGNESESAQLLSLTTKGIKKINIEDSKGKTPMSYDTYQKVCKDDLVLCLFDLDVSAVFSDVSKYYGMISPAYQVFESDIVNMNYYKYIFDKIFQDRSYKLHSKSLRYTITPDNFLMLDMIVPPKDEQEQIARFLDWKINEIDGLILKKKEKLKRVDNYVKINIFKMLDRLNNEEIPLKRILAEKMTDGPHETPAFVSDGIPFVSVEAVENGRINLRKKRGFISSETSQKYRKKVKPQKDDIFIVKSGSTTGKIAYVDFDEEFDIWSPLALVRVKKNINKKYIFYYLSSELFQQQIKDNWTFGTQPNIGMSTLINLKIKIPSKQKQDFLANNIELIINRIENIKYNITKQINNLQLLKQSLISDVVTGKIDVRNVVIPEYDKASNIKDDYILEENFSEEV